MAVLALTGAALALRSSWPAWSRLVLVGPSFVIVITWATSPWWLRITLIVLAVLGRYIASRNPHGLTQSDSFNS